MTEENKDEADRIQRQKIDHSLRGVFYGFLFLITAGVLIGLIIALIVKGV